MIEVGIILRIPSMSGGERLEAVVRRCESVHVGDGGVLVLDGCVFPDGELEGTWRFTYPLRHVQQWSVRTA